SLPPETSRPGAPIGARLGAHYRDEVSAGRIDDDVVEVRIAAANVSLHDLVTVARNDGEDGARVGTAAPATRAAVGGSARAAGADDHDGERGHPGWDRPALGSVDKDHLRGPCILSCNAAHEQSQSDNKTCSSSHRSRSFHDHSIHSDNSTADIRSP